ncbi:MAG: DUF3667 domain-containing protein [Planctomycetota bacterium]
MSNPEPLENPSVEPCRRCQNDVTGPFCSACGLPRQVSRIDARFLATEIAAVFNFKKGLFHTFRELLLHPGDSVRRYLCDDRSSLLKPISFLILGSLFYLLAHRVFQFQDGYVNYSGLEWSGSSIPVIMEWITQNYGLSNLIMAFYTAAWIKLFFRRYDFNFFEVLILLCYVIGVEMILFAIFGLTEAAIGYGLLDKASLLVVVYGCWAIGQFFNGRRIRDYVYALLCYFLGMISFIFSAIACGVVYDLIRNTVAA